MNFKINSSKKVWKVLGAAGLAVFMGGMGLFGALGAPANASAASGPDSAAATAGADPYGLDPQNDKVIADLGGIEIKYHNLTATSTNTGVVHPALPGLPYVTMSDGRNYIIIGMHSSFGNDFRDNPVNDVVQGSTTQWDLADGTPASIAIIKEYFNLSGVATSDRIDTELKPGQMLCLCSTVTTSTKYLASNSNAVYKDSTLYNQMNTLYAAFSATEKKFIAPVNLVTQWGQGYSTTQDNGLYVFAMAGVNQVAENFHILNYLSSGLQIAVPGSIWWTRSGATGVSYYAMLVTAAGGLGSTASGDSRGVRPAFVLDLNGGHGA